MITEDTQLAELKVYQAILALRPDAHFTLKGEPATEADYLTAITWRDDDEPPSWAEIVPLL
nr:hypothetical protein [uncultured Cohaesibacter sp.]